MSSSKEPVVKNSKFAKVINNMNEESEYDQNNFDSEDEYLKKEMNDDKFNQIVFNIKQNLIKFIDDKSLPLCEFLTLGKLKMFIKKEIIL